MPFIFNKWTSLLKIWIEAGALGLKFLFPSWSWSFSAPIFVSELELELLGFTFFYQSWSWSLKALGVKLESAPNWSRLSISAIFKDQMLINLWASASNVRSLGSSDAGHWNYLKRIYLVSTATRIQKYKKKEKSLSQNSLNNILSVLGNLSQVLRHYKVPA